MKYKHTRKEIEAMLVEAVKVGCGYYSMPNYIFHLIKDSLLAQKEDKKECKHKLGDKEEHDNLGTYHIAGDTCVKCGKHIMDWDNPTPSPLKGFEKIESVHFGNDTYQTLENFYDSIKKLISNQKKLYQFIKEKKL